MNGDLKELNKQLKDLNTEIGLLELEIRGKRQEIDIKYKERNNLLNKISNVKNIDNLNVSDHAIVRYFERVKGVDIEEVKKEILTEEVVKLTKTLGGNGKYPNEEFKVIMKNFCVTTII